MNTPPLHTLALGREIKRPLSFMSKSSPFATSIQRDGYFTPVSVASDGPQSSHSNSTNPPGNGFGIIGSGPPSASSTSVCGTPVHPFGPVSRPVSSISLVAPPTLVLPQTLNSSAPNTPASPEVPLRFSTPGPALCTSIRSRSVGELEEELKQTKKELSMLKSMDPFKAADMAIEIQMNQMRLHEATSARDSAVQRLSSAYDSIKQKAQQITTLTVENSKLEQINAELSQQLKALEQSVAQEVEQRLGLEVTKMRQGLEEELEARVAKEIRMRSTGSSASNRLSIGDAEYNCGISSYLTGPASAPVSLSPTPLPFFTQSDTEQSLASLIDGIGQLNLQNSECGSPNTFNTASTFSNIPRAPYLRLPQQLGSPGGQNRAKNDWRMFPTTRPPAEATRIRNEILSSLPVPDGVPEDTIRPIVLPPPYTLQEFLANATGAVKDELAGYRVFQEPLTCWCPEMEEHGYFLTPLFKCSTNPRVITAHWWTEVDPIGMMSKPTECFYSREGRWYYAGQYIALRFEDLSIGEWEALSTEATTILIKDTLNLRKNNSPQNHYEASQLYACGALRVACVGLQCVGFNRTLYETLIEQSERCTSSGTWSDPWGSNLPVGATPWMKRPGEFGGEGFPLIERG